MWYIVYRIWHRAFCIWYIVHKDPTSQGSLESPLALEPECRILDGGGIGGGARIP